MNLENLNDNPYKSYKTLRHRYGKGYTKVHQIDLHDVESYGVGFIFASYNNVVRCLENPNYSKFADKEWRCRYEDVVFLIYGQYLPCLPDKDRPWEVRVITSSNPNIPVIEENLVMKAVKSSFKKISKAKYKILKYPLWDSMNN